MLPMKLDLSKPLAIKLRELRLNTPVNGEVLTAEALSKAIGNNRAWMSQIESRRLKKIRREDIISIYKLLFNLSTEKEAEDKAELDLLNYIMSDRESTLVIAHPQIVEEKNKNNAVKKNVSPKVSYKAYKSQCFELYHLLLDLYENETPNNKPSLENLVNKLLLMLTDKNILGLNTILEVPFDLYKYADSIETKEIKIKINELSKVLQNLEYKRILNDFKEEVSTATLYTLKNKQPLSNVPSKLFNCFLFLTQLLFNQNPLSLMEKRDLTNDLIFLMKMYASKKVLEFTLEPLDVSINMNDIKIAINYMQSFINQFKDTSFYLLNQVSTYNDDINS